MTGRVNDLLGLWVTCIHTQREDILSIVKWIRWYFILDTGFEIHVRAVWDRAGYLLVMKALPFDKTLRGDREKTYSVSLKTEYESRGTNPDLGRDKRQR